MKPFLTILIYLCIFPKLHAIDPYSIFMQGEIINYSHYKFLYPLPTEAEFLDNHFIFSKQTISYNALIGIDFKTIPGVYNLLIKSFDSIIEIIPIIIINGNFRDEFLKVDRKFVEFPPDIVERINKERETLTYIYQKSPTEPLFNSRFIHPLADNTFITSDFGTRRIYNNLISGRHGGIDFRAKIGTPVKASNSGVVELSDHFFLPGKIVVINHGAGIYTNYLHLSSFSVVPGDNVKKGQVIGKTGATGRITGPHLDFRVKIFRSTINPMRLINIDFDL